ncbi:hypothetical protein AVEN_213324-1 [Araneus ventricosus]|uniref:CRAL/TRIO N-terminal domain-containing protein n=1 Tax=Araneus ventricosus TaxID=182803 RepID=A0A4Y2ID87_ARAVE|nr:hypothetical protein AVEN_213324-1 [Araneus ventricosus]
MGCRIKWRPNHLTTVKNCEVKVSQKNQERLGVTMNKDEPDICCQNTRFDATKPNLPALEDIQKEIGETEETRIRGLETLRQKLKELEDIEACLDEEFLLRFLRVESFDSLTAFQRLKNFYDMQEEMLEMFKHCSIDASVVQSMPYFWALPYRPKNNSALLVVTMGKDYCFLEDILQFVMTTHYKI